MDDETKLKVIKFHDSVCEYSHTDECGWMYEIKSGVHDWNGISHIGWVERYLEAKNNGFKDYYTKTQYEE